MCKLLVLNKLYLGARELGCELIDLNKLEVIEMTAGQIKSALKAGKEILGVKVSAGNELELDKEKYFMTNLMRKVHINKLEPLYDTESSLANIFFYVAGVTEKNGKTLYNCINSRFGRCQMDDNKLRVYYEMGAIAGGIKIENDKIIVSDLIKTAEKKPEPVVEVEKKPGVTEPKKESVTENEKSEVKEKKPEEPKKSETKVENSLNEKIVSVEVEKVAKSKTETTKVAKSKK